LRIGASARAVLRAAEAAGLGSLIVGVDASPAMLEQARAKQWPAGVRFEVGQAERVAWSASSWGLGHQIDGAVAAYLFRNVANRDAVLAVLFDLLADCGVLVVQEYSIAGSSFLAKVVWTVVCWLVVIPLGWLTARRTRLYRYLSRSVRSFDSLQTFVDRLYRAGFVDVEVATVSGWQRGILHNFRAASLRPFHDHWAAQCPLETWPGCSRCSSSGRAQCGPLDGAVRLAERGVPVIMVEPHEQLGGRVRSWPVTHGDDQVTLSRGFMRSFGSTTHFGRCPGESIPICSPWWQSRTIRDLG
jgi:ubiquinone/menaquinone biosynthesis C-methylase UbiE